MANLAPSETPAQAAQVENQLIPDEHGLGALGIILIVVLLLILFGVIGFSFNS